MKAIVQIALLVVATLAPFIYVQRTYVQPQMDKYVADIKEINRKYDILISTQKKELAKLKAENAAQNKKLAESKGPAIQWRAGSALGGVGTIIGDSRRSIRVQDGPPYYPTIATLENDEIKIMPGYTRDDVINALCKDNYPKDVMMFKRALGEFDCL